MQILKVKQKQEHNRSLLIFTEFIAFVWNRSFKLRRRFVSLKKPRGLFEFHYV